MIVLLILVLSCYKCNVYTLLYQKRRVERRFWDFASVVQKGYFENLNSIVGYMRIYCRWVKIVCVLKIYHMPRPISAASMDRNWRGSDPLSIRYRVASIVKGSLSFERLPSCLNWAFAPALVVIIYLCLVLVLLTRAHRFRIIQRELICLYIVLERYSILQHFLQFSI